MRAHFRLHGLTVSADVTLPAHRVPAAPTDLKLEVVHSSWDPTTFRQYPKILAHGASVGGLAVHHRAEDGRLWAEFPGLALYTWTQLPCSCSAYVNPSLPRETAELLFSSSVLSLIQAVRGKCVLHAAAVAHKDAALVVVGSSGAGKTTLAALACARGARLLTDDALVVSPRGRVWSGEPGTLSLRSRHPLAAPVQEWPVSSSVDGRHCYWPATSPRPTPLRSVLLVEATDNGPAQVTRLTPAQALLPLSLGMRTLGFTDDAHQRRQFRWAAKLARDLPVLRLQYRRADAKSELSELCDYLLEERHLGLL